LPFLDKGVKVEEMIDWAVGEMMDVSNTVWQLNDNFTVMGIGGVLNMLNGEGCQELNWLRNPAAFHDVAVLGDVPEDVHRLVGWIMQRWWKPHGLPGALCRLEAARATTVRYSDK
jgi:hypothetical protein